LIREPVNPGDFWKFREGEIPSEAYCIPPDGLCATETDLFPVVMHWPDHGLLGLELAAEYGRAAALRASLAGKLPSVASATGPCAGQDNLEQEARGQRTTVEESAADELRDTTAGPPDKFTFLQRAFAAIVSSPGRTHEEYAVLCGVSRATWFRRL